jgi:hypothetical protein|tara:strand:+ start:108 stop:392 length:285 start_codon:yes stop_codon:yes gene_type:complete
VDVIGIYGQYGAVGVGLSLLAYLVVKLSSDNTKNTESINKIETKLDNIEGMIIKLIDRWNKADDKADSRHEKVVEVINDVTDDVNFLKGRVNSK